MPNDQISSCCRAPINVCVDDEGTGFFVCRECDMPCNLMPTGNDWNGPYDPEEVSACVSCLCFTHTVHKLEKGLVNLCGKCGNEKVTVATHPMSSPKEGDSTLTTTNPSKTSNQLVDEEYVKFSAWFDKEYGHEVLAWTLGIVSEALLQGQRDERTHKYNDASHITRKLRDLLQKFEEEAYSKAKRTV